MHGDTDVLEQEPGTARAGAVQASSLRPPGRHIDYRDAAKRLIERCITDARNNVARLDRDRADWYNLLMYRGGRSQWMVYDRATNNYVERGVDPDQGGLPEWVPRPSTNIFRTVIDGIASILDQSEPAKQWYPSTDDDADRATAEVAEDAEPVLLDEIDYDAHRSEMNKLVTLTSAVALAVYYDNDPKYGTDDIPLMRCPVCETIVSPMELEDAGLMCPECQQAQEEEFEPVIDAEGAPSGVPYQKGRLCARLIPSFEFSLPSTARTPNSRREPWILTHSEYSPEEALARWPNAREAIQHAGAKKAGGLQRSYARAMRQLSAPMRASAMYDTPTGTTKSGPTVYILQHDPIDDGEFFFPDGLHVVMVGDELVEGGPLPVTDDAGRAVKSILVRVFTQAPGAPYGQPPGDDLAPLQVTRNLVDALIQLILMHDAAPRTLIPLSVTLENQPTGRPGESIFYRSVVPGDKPTVERGVNPPEGLYKYLEIIDTKFQEVSKLNSVLIGARPSGEPTLGEVQILQERGIAAFKDPLDQLVRFERDLSRTLMWIAKQSVWTDRFRQVRGENGQWEISQFNAADLRGKVDVVIEKQTAWPKSSLMRMLRLQKAHELQILPPPLQDPELQSKLLVELDLTYLKPSLDHDRKQIARELDRWKAATSPGQIAPPDPTTQELPIHLFFKKQFLKTEEWEALREQNPAVAQAMVAHVQQIERQIQQAQIAQAQALAAAQQPPPPPPDQRTPAERGDGSAVDAAVDAGVLRPAEQAADPMQAAVDSGVLVPAAAASAVAVTGPSVDQLMEQGLIAPAPEEPRG